MPAASSCRRGSHGASAPLLFPSALDTPFESQGPSESLIGQLWSHERPLVTWQEKIGHLGRGESPQKEMGMLLSKEGDQMLDRKKVRKLYVAPESAALPQDEQ